MPSLPCSPCPIPLGNLTLSWSGGDFGTGSVTLAHIVTVDGFGDPLDLWQATQVFTFPGFGAVHILFTLSCSSGVLTFEANDLDFVLVHQNCRIPCLGPGACFHEVTADRTCTPFHIHYTTNFAANSGSCGIFYQEGLSPHSYITDFFLDA